MEFFILFIVLGTISYLVIKRSVNNATTTPIWLLWLVLMSPAFIWIFWRLINPEEKSIPIILVIVPLLLSPLIYLWLIVRGKPQKKIKTSSLNSDQILDENDQSPQLTNKRPITTEEEKNLRDCFPWGIYYLQKIDYLPQAIVCLGKLKTIPENAYKTVKSNVENVFNDRYLVIFQESLQGQPFFALIPNPYAKSKQKNSANPDEKLTRPWLALGLLLLTLITTNFVGVGFSLQSEIQSLMVHTKNATFSNILFNQIISEPSLFLKGLPYSLSLILILGVHELSHYLLAVYYRMKTTLPYFMPIPFFLGTFGAFISLKSPTPNRKALFDVAIAGPLGGFVVTIPVLIWGLALSDVVDISKSTSILNFEALNPRFSCLFAILTKMALGSNFIPNTAIALSPMAIAGFIGLIITALNLMPIGQLDGGHIVHAMFGQGKGIIIGQITRLLMFVLAFIHQEFLLWAIILFFMPVADQPALNDVTELDDKRDFLGLISLALLVIILLPLPPTIAQWLNI